MTKNKHLDDNKTPKPVPNDFRTLAVSRVTYEALRAWDVANGDQTAKVWDKLDRESQDTVVANVNWYITNPLAGPGAQHRSWVDKRSVQPDPEKDSEEVAAQKGWKWGRVFSVERKEDPRMVPFHLLPNAEQVKDRIFVAIVRAASQV